MGFSSEDWLPISDSGTPWDPLGAANKNSGGGQVNPSAYMPLIEKQAQVNRVNTVNPYGSSFFIGNDQLGQMPSFSTGSSYTPPNNLSPGAASIIGRSDYRPPAYNPSDDIQWGDELGQEGPEPIGWNQGSYGGISPATRAPQPRQTGSGLDPEGVTQVTSLSPELQPLLKQQIDIAGGSPYGEAESANRALLARALNPEQTNESVRDATYAQAMDLLNPQLEQQESRFIQRLSDQGIPIDSDAYSKAYADLSGSQNRARQNAAYQSVLSGQQAALSERGQNINELMGAAGQGLQGSNQKTQLIAQLLGGNQPSGIQPIDVTGPANLAANQNLAQQQMQQQQKNSQTNAGVGLGTAAMSMMSDRRTKTDIKHIGFVNGVKVYLYRFKDWAVKRFGLPSGEIYGVMSDEVRHIKGAVTRAPDGFDRVNMGVVLWQ